MGHWSVSKHADKNKAGNDGRPDKETIYSHSTMANYQDAAIRFVKWARDTHGCRDVDSARQYAGDYIRYRMDHDYSAWTVRRDAAAIAKLYKTRTTDIEWGVKLPVRHRADVTQHRTNASSGHFSESRNRDLVDLCRGTGLRRHEVAALRPEDVSRADDGRLMVHVERGKGGKTRDVAVLPQYADRISAMASKAAAAGQGTVISHIPKYAPCHVYRAEYARNMYAMLARDTSTLPRSEVYRCRLDRSGVEFDKVAMGLVSKNLGHSRLDVMTSYLC